MVESENCKRGVVQNGLGEASNLRGKQLRIIEYGFHPFW